MKDTGAGPIGASGASGSSWFGLKLLVALAGGVSCRVKRIATMEIRILRESRDLGAKGLFFFFVFAGTSCVNVRLWTVFWRL
jgi:hypothetical protein